MLQIQTLETNIAANLFNTYLSIKIYKLHMFFLNFYHFLRSILNLFISFIVHFISLSTYFSFLILLATTRVHPTHLYRD